MIPRSGKMGKCKIERGKLCELILSYIALHHDANPTLDIFAAQHKFVLAHGPKPDHPRLRAQQMQARLK